MDLIPTDLLVVLVLFGVIGIVARPPALRMVCWLLALPPLAIGVLALYQGGIADGFSPWQMLTFCAFTFTPAIGCTIGEFLLFWQRKKNGQNKTIHVIAAERGKT